MELITMEFATTKHEQFLSIQGQAEALSMYYLTNYFTLDFKTWKKTL